eukprot:12777851-Ditylum_brightwellii.AAC.1
MIVLWKPKYQPSIIFSFSSLASDNSFANTSISYLGIGSSSSFGNSGPWITKRIALSNWRLLSVTGKSITSQIVSLV